MSNRALCVVCCAPVAEGRVSLWRRAAAVQGCPGDALPLCLTVLPKFSLDPGLCATAPPWGTEEAGTWAAEIPQDTVHGVLCCAVLCCAVLCCAVLCCAVLCCAEGAVTNMAKAGMSCTRKCKTGGP